ncbi:RnfABCDGE type electron transport complex subunit B [Neisseria lactamica]|uniref:RnfABCDGE type electron transport complex subunit B n=1 Tax=Neisseria lactamica TaxID=486 RepID=UPI000307B529|nr:RnfABCDGE type electron transport complex subunit B [Neisseria lactamica]
MTATAADLDRILPQTQCRECGYEGCLPYARAMLRGEAHNLCTPGGEAVVRDLAALLSRPVAAPAKTQAKALARIDESACIGCTACIRACPADAIMGAGKFMHTVIADECTGCGLCVAPCPVDCIRMQPVSDAFLPRARRFSLSADSRFAAAEHARARYLRHNERKQRETAERKAMLAEREAAVRNARLQTADTPGKTAFDPAGLIAKAMAQAQTRQDRLVAADNRKDYQAKQIAEARERAELRRAQRDMKYGGEDEKAAALEYLKQYKAKQEAAQNTAP